jgi:hypothetical protein
MHDFFWRMGEGAQFRIALKIKGGSWLACDGGGAVGIYVA